MYRDGCQRGRERRMERLKRRKMRTSGASRAQFASIVRFICLLHIRIVSKEDKDDRTPWLYLESIFKFK